MSTLLIFLMLTLVAIAGTVVVGTPDPQRQSVVLSAFGLLLAVLFVVLQAPDVALSQLAVGTAVVPLMVLLAVRTIRRGRGRQR